MKNETTGSVKISIAVEAPKALLRYKAPVALFHRYDVTLAEAEIILEQWRESNPELNLMGQWQPASEWL